MNKTFIFGHMGKDPESRFTASGQKVTTFSVATNRRRGDKEETMWWRVTVWGDRFDKMLSYLKKGSAVIVMGELHINEWTDASGQTQKSLEITAESINFPPFGRGDPNKQEQGTQGASGQQPQPTQQFSTPQSFGENAGAPSSFPTEQTTVGQGDPAPANVEDEPLPF